MRSETSPKNERPAVCGQLCIQFPAELAPELHIGRLKEAAERIAERTEGIVGVEFGEGEDEGAYVDIAFITETPLEAWLLVKAALLDSADLCSLRSSCVCVCTGESGWNDYLLLYHFDPTVSLYEPGNA